MEWLVVSTQGTVEWRRGPTAGWRSRTVRHLERGVPRAVSHWRECEPRHFGYGQTLAML